MFVLASKEISAQEYFEQIENSFTVEEMHTEIFLDDVSYIFSPWDI